VAAATDALNRIDKELADFATELLDLRAAEAAKVGRLVDAVEKRGHARSS
jgi:hypothetical protein